MLGWKKALFLLCLISRSASACTVQDDERQPVHLAQPAERIVSLAPDMTEMVYAIGAGDKIVGVMQGSDYPEAARQQPVVANYHALNQEAIMARHPDLVIAWAGTSSHQLAWLAHLGAAVYVSRQKNITDIPVTLRKLGCLAGTEREANRIAAQFEKRLKRLQEQGHRHAPVTVFYEVTDKPLMTINQESWINQVITLCGGKNIFADAPVIAPVVSREAILARNPEVIIAKDFSTWQSWPQLRAVKNHHLFSIPPDWLERAGPRVILGAERMCQNLTTNEVHNSFRF